AIEVARCAGQLLAGEMGNMLQCGCRGQCARFAKVLAAAKEVVDFDAEAQLPQRPLSPAVGRKNKRQRFGQGAADTAAMPLPHASPTHEAKPALGKVAHPAMQESAGAAAGAEGEIMLLNQPGAQAAHGSVAHDAGADDAAADHEEIEGFLAQEI